MSDAELCQNHLDGRVLRMGYEKSLVRSGSAPRWRASWPGRLSAMVLGVLLVGGCGDLAASDSGEQSQGGSDEWGPLAVMSGAGSSSEAAAAGTLSVTDECVFLQEEGGDEVILVWPERRTSWDEESESVTFEGDDGNTVTIEDGSRIEVGGGGDSVHESGRSAKEWRGDVDWVSEPPLDCVTDGRWMIGDIERR